MHLAPQSNLAEGALLFLALEQTACLQGERTESHFQLDDGFFQLRMLA